MNTTNIYDDVFYNEETGLFTQNLLEILGTNVGTRFIMHLGVDKLKSIYTPAQMHEAILSCPHSLYKEIFEKVAHSEAAWKAVLRHGKNGQNAYDFSLENFVIVLNELD